MRRLASTLRAALVCAVLLALASPAFAQTVRLGFVFSDGNLPGTLAAYKALLAERPDLRGQVSLTFLTESMFDDIAPQDMSSSNVLLLDVMNQQMLDRFNEKHKIDVIAVVARRGTVLAIGEGVSPRERYASQGVVFDETARTFWAHLGFNNQLGLLKLALTRAGVKGLTVPKPEPSLGFGYYYPDGRTGRVFATWNEFVSWKRANGKVARPGAFRVAVGFYKASYYTGEMELIDAVIAEVERRGAEAVPFFGYPDAEAAQRLLADPAGGARADVVLSLLFRFAGPEASPILQKLDIPVINLISLYGRTEQEWRASSTGLSFFEGTFQVAVPELAGLVAPTVIGSQEKVRDPDSGLTVVTRKPLPDQVSKAVRRGLRYATLRAKANGDKRVAIVFYDYPAGKANIGASYLNVAESIAQILQRLAAEGYDVGNAVRPSSSAGGAAPSGVPTFTGTSVLNDLAAKARNIAGYAPGELRALVNQGSAARIGMTDYHRWLGALAPTLRDKIVADWGPPEQSKVMTVKEAAGTSFVVPVVTYGKVALLPQPARGWGEDKEKLFHAKNLAPPHQYVATYAWLREGYKADAVVHVGTHGTLEWLDGKDIGLSSDDASDALMADLPDLYLYNVDVVGEGLVARRRGLATLVDHMVPPFKKGGLLPELSALSESITDFDKRRGDSPELAQVYAEQIREKLIALGIAKDLHLSLEKPGSVTEEVLHDVEEHLLTLKGQNIPYGLHTFGKAPGQVERDTTVDAIVSADRSLLPNKAKALAKDMDARIVSGAARELDNLMRALRGGFVGTGGGGEPIRNPDAYPTGKNFYGIDPDKVPKPASWELGSKLAQQMIVDHRAHQYKYP